jgi:hypothetical protein
MSSEARPSSGDYNGGMMNTAAAGVPAVPTVGTDTNQAPAPTEESAASPTSDGKGVPKKYFYLGGVILVAVIVALVVVVVVVVNNKKDSGPAPAANTTGESAPTSTPPPSSPGGVESTPTLATIAQRGSLKCGITLQPGFGSESDGEYTGFDADLVSM